MKQLTASIRNSLRKFLLNFFVLPLLRFSYWLKRLQHKQLSNLHINLHYLLKCKIRLLIPDAKSEGFDDHLDMVINSTALILARPNLFEEAIPEMYFEGLEDEAFKSIKSEQESLFNQMRDKYQSNKNEIDALVELIRGERGIQDTIKNLCLLDNLMGADLENPQKTEYFLWCAKEIDSDTSSLTHDDVGKLKKQTKHALKKHRNEIADKEAVKLSITLSQLGSGIALLSALFVVSGYLYDKYYLGAFGIDVSKYFTISDYLSTSVESIRYAGFSGFFATVFTFLGFHHGSRKSYAQLEYERGQKDYTLHVFGLILIVNVIVSYFVDQLLFYSALLMFAVVAALPLSDIISRKYFKQPIPVLFFLVFVALFFVRLYYSAARSVYQAQDETLISEATERYEYEFMDTIKLSDKNVVMLAANSNYYFFWDFKQETSIILPKDAIKKIITKTRPAPTENSAPEERDL